MKSPLAVPKTLVNRTLKKKFKNLKILDFGVGLKQNTFKPLHPDTTGVASSAHVRKLTWLDWSDEANQSLLLTDTHSITRYYGRSMGADIELSKLSTALGGYGDHSLRDLFSKVSNTAPTAFLAMSSLPPTHIILTLGFLQICQTAK